MSQIGKKQIIILVIVALLFGGYYFYITRVPETDSLLSGASQDRLASSIPGRDLTILLNELRSVSLNVEVFSDPAYVQLIDYTLPLLSEPKSRIDPLAPVDDGQ